MGYDKVGQSNEWTVYHITVKGIKIKVEGVAVKGK